VRLDPEQRNAREIGALRKFRQLAQFVLGERAAKTSILLDELVALGFLLGFDLGVVGDLLLEKPLTQSFHLLSRAMPPRSEIAPFEMRVYANSEPFDALIGVI
jgi:hypothetical protein